LNHSNHENTDRRVHVGYIATAFSGQIVPIYVYISNAHNATAKVNLTATVTMSSNNTNEFVAEVTANFAQYPN
jgi:hypothetical protein